MAEKVSGCLKGVCDDIRECSRCGWNEKEAARRKIIPRKPHTAEVKEGE